MLRPNYHGSSNYGLRWLESITRGSYGEPELVDIEKGVDELIAPRPGEPGRLGLVGWSNGAILANLLTARTTRYQAASVGAGTCRVRQRLGELRVRRRLQPLLHRQSRRSRTRRGIASARPSAAWTACGRRP